MRYERGCLWGVGLLAFALIMAAACSGGSSGLANNGTSGGGAGVMDGSLSGAAGNPSLLVGTTNGGSGGGNCEPNLTGTVRDFRATHPDFERYNWPYFRTEQGPLLKEHVATGVVEQQLGDDEKPVFSNVGKTFCKLDDNQESACFTGKATFDQWYRNVAGVNQSFPFRLQLQDNGNGTATYNNQEFFPIDDVGFGHESSAYPDHNFNFTFELHTEFLYRGGEEFSFEGDDDLWVFINRKLAIDLGGLHTPKQASVQLDAQAQDLRIEREKTYRLDIFHAERHTDKSHFRIDTSIQFTNCNPILR